MDITHSRFLEDVQVPGNNSPIQHRKMGKSRQPGGLPVLMQPAGPKARKPSPLGMDLLEVAQLDLALMLPG